MNAEAFGVSGQRVVSSLSCRCLDRRRILVTAWLASRPLEVPMRVVRILGPLELRVDGAALSVRGPKRRGLLAFLAARATASSSIDAICAAIWPDHPVEAARRSV